MNEFDESRFEHHLQRNPRLALRRMLVLDPQAASALLRGRLRFRHRGSIEGATASLDVAVILRGGRIPFLWRALREQRFAIGGSRASGPAIWRHLAAHHRQLEVWAENCPENFANRAALVGAEIARLEGRELDADAPLRTGHPLGPRQRLRPQRGARQ